MSSHTPLANGKMCKSRGSALSRVTRRLRSSKNLRLSPEVATALIGSFCFGYNVSALDSCIGDIASALEWCGQGMKVQNCQAAQIQEGFVTASIYIAAAGGSALIGVQRLAHSGSRGFLCISSLSFFLGAVICSLARDANMLLVGRGFSGIGLSISGVMTPLYIGEMSPTKYRGSCVAFHSICISLGILASIAVGLPQKPANSEHGESESFGLNTWYWRVILGVPAPASLLQFILHSWVFPSDSPRILVERGFLTQALESLTRINQVHVEASDDEASGKREDATCALLVHNELHELVLAVDDSKTVSHVSVLDAFMDAAYLRFPMFLGLFLACMQQLCGIACVYSYSNDLFRQAGIPPAYLTLSSTGMAIANVAANFMSLWLVDSWGRRNLLLLGTSMQALSMISLSVLTQDGHPTDFESVAVVFLIVVFVVAFSIGLGPITWLYLAEIYPMEIKSRALALCSGSNWICSFLIVFGSRFLTVFQAGQLFGMSCGIGCALMYIFVLETKGCSMDDNPVSPRSGRSNSILTSPNSCNSNFNTPQTGPLSPPRDPWSPRTPLLRSGREFSETPGPRSPALPPLLKLHRITSDSEGSVPASPAIGMSGMDKSRSDAPDVP